MTGYLTTYTAVLAVLLRAQREGDHEAEVSAIEILDSLWSELSELEEVQAIALVESVNSGRLSIDDIWRFQIAETSDAGNFRRASEYEVRTRTTRVSQPIRQWIEHREFASAAYA